MARHGVSAYGLLMASTAGLLRAPGRWLAALFWPSNTSQNLGFILASLPVQLAAPAIIAVSWLVIWAGRLPGMLTTLLGTIEVVVLLVAAIPALTAARRTTWPGLMTWLRAEATWRQLAYHVLVAPVLALAGLLMPFLWTAGIVLAAIFAYVG